MSVFTLISCRTCFIVLSIGGLAAPVLGSQTISVPGTDVISLAGRSDVTLAPAGTPPGGYLFARNSPAGPAAETFPALISVGSSQAYQFSATGLVTFSSADTRGPDGEVSFASLNALAGISGYAGPKSSLNGVFLNANDPQNSTAPATIAYSGSNTISSATFSPGLDQVFFIGDGLTGTGTGSVQTFNVPSGATRLYLGYSDGLFFSGAPGEYDDNSGALSVTVTSVPEPSSAALIAVGLVGVSCRRKRAAGCGTIIS